MTWNDWLSLIQLFAPALIAAAAVGFAGASAGVFVLLRRESLMALALPQIVAVGAALTLRWELEGISTLGPPLVIAVAAVLYFVLLKRRGGNSGMGAWLLPSFYVAGLCLSFLLIANKGHEVSTLQSLFTGIDVAVTPHQAMVAVPILIAAGLVCAILWRRWLLIAQTPAAAELAGLHTPRWDALFLFLLTLILLLGTGTLGVVMVLSLLFLPAATAMPWTKRIPAALIVSAALSLFFVAGGFYLSNTMSWPFSQSVGGIGFAVLVASHVLRLLV